MSIRILGDGGPPLPRHPLFWRQKSVADKEPGHQCHLFTVVEDGNAPPLPGGHPVLLQQLLEPPAAHPPHRFQHDAGGDLKTHRERLVPPRCPQPFAIRSPEPELPKPVRQSERLFHPDGQHLLAGGEIRRHQVQAPLIAAARQPLQAQPGVGVIARQRHLLPQQAQQLAGGHLSPLAADPVAQQVVAPHGGEGEESVNAQPFSLTHRLPVRLGQLADERLLLGAQGHGARRRPGHGGPAVLEQGDDLLAQEVAVIARVLVALILNPAIRK